MKKKQYMKPQAEIIISTEFPCMLAGSKNEQYIPEPGPPGAKKNFWDTVDEGSDSLYDFSRVGNFRNKLWDD